MLSYDQQVRHGGLTFRLHTEHHEIGADSLIVSALQFGQATVSTRKVRLPRAGTVGAETAQPRIVGLLGRQHRRLLAELTRGRLDASIAATPGTGEFRAVAAAEPSLTEAASAAGEAPRESAAGLDRIVLELLDTDTVGRAGDASPAVDPAEVAPASTQATERRVADHDQSAGEFADAQTTSVGPFDYDTDDLASPPAPTTFSGDLTTLAVPDLLEFLTVSRRSGALVVVGRRGIAEIHLQLGALSGAVATCCRTIGALLAEAGEVSEDELSQANLAQETEHSNWSLGAILVGQGTVTRQALEDALRRQVHEVLRELVGWTEGRFTFDPEGSGTWSRRSEVEIALDTRGVLLDVMRQIDEEAR